MKNKIRIIVTLCSILSILIVNLVSAEMLVSEAGVEYEDRILEEFAKLEGTNETFVPLIIELKDFSKANDLLSIFSNGEIKDVAIRDLSNRIGVDLTEEAFFKLIQDNRVEGVYYDYPLYLSLAESAPLINADDAWDTLGYTGNNVKVCVIDTGVDTTHPDLSARIVDEKCYCRGGGGCCPNNEDEDDSAEDEDGHGTHVAGIIASQDSTYKGIAYDSDVYVTKVQLNSK